MILSILAIALIVSGTILGAYLSYNFEKDVQIRQEKIEQLNKDIENIVITGKLLNEEILSITSNTKKLTENVQTITNNIQDAQGDLNDITESTRKLVDENILVAQQANLLVEKLTNFQTGGESYCEIELDYIDSTNRVHINAIAVGSYTMRNVRIHIRDNRPQPAKIGKFPLPKLMDYKVIHNQNGNLILDMGDMKWFSGIELIFLDYNEFSDYLDFSIVVDSENFSTQQKILAYDIASNEESKRYSKITIQRGDMGGKVLSEKNYNFPIDNNGIPIIRRK